MDIEVSNINSFFNKGIDNKEIVPILEYNINRSLFDELKSYNILCIDINKDIDIFCVGTKDGEIILINKMSMKIISKINTESSKSIINVYIKTGKLNSIRLFAIDEDGNLLYWIIKEESLIISHKHSIIKKKFIAPIKLIEIIKSLEEIVLITTEGHIILANIPNDNQIQNIRTIYRNKLYDTRNLTIIYSNQDEEYFLYWVVNNYLYIYDIKHKNTIVIYPLKQYINNNNSLSNSIILFKHSNQQYISIQNRIFSIYIYKELSESTLRNIKLIYILTIPEKYKIISVRPFYITPFKNSFIAILLMNQECFNEIELILLDKLFHVITHHNIKFLTRSLYNEDNNINSNNYIDLLVNKPKIYNFLKTQMIINFNHNKSFIMISRTSSDDLLWWYNKKNEINHVLYLIDENISYDMEIKIIIDLLKKNKVKESLDILKRRIYFNNSLIYSYYLNNKIEDLLFVYMNLYNFFGYFEEFVTLLIEYKYIILISINSMKWFFKLIKCVFVYDIKLFIFILNSWFDVIKKEFSDNEITYQEKLLFFIRINEPWISELKLCSGLSSLFLKKEKGYIDNIINCKRKLNILFGYIKILQLYQRKSSYEEIFIICIHILNKCIDNNIFEEILIDIIDKISSNDIGQIIIEHINCILLINNQNILELLLFGGYVSIKILYDCIKNNKNSTFIFFKFLVYWQDKLVDSTNYIKDSFFSFNISRKKKSIVANYEIKNISNNVLYCLDENINDYLLLDDVKGIKNSFKILPLLYVEFAPHQLLNFILKFKEKLDFNILVNEINNKIEGLNVDFSKFVEYNELNRRNFDNEVIHSHIYLIEAKCLSLFLNNKSNNQKELLYNDLFKTLLNRNLVFSCISLIILYKEEIEFLWLSFIEQLYSSNNQNIENFIIWADYISKKAFNSDLNCYQLQNIYSNNPVRKYVENILAYFNSHYNCSLSIFCCDWHYLPFNFELFESKLLDELKRLINFSKVQIFQNVKTIDSFIDLGVLSHLKFNLTIASSSSNVLLSAQKSLKQYFLVKLSNSIIISKDTDYCNICFRLLLNPNFTKKLHKKIKKVESILNDNKTPKYYPYNSIRGISSGSLDINNFSLKDFQDVNEGSIVIFNCGHSYHYYCYFYEISHSKILSEYLNMVSDSLKCIICLYNNTMSHLQFS
ncbi:uncharacterized protein CMU_042150 [Cryptosporidium muris RN66]|uniref:Uncharacterized protein n=1 Tax=Cryptosporidium muris (strain RN66) TaxID=441375 RepID=B6AAA1_CRYMR|nr:uncharacterized protein CMU_042150 [Cryptosporidium muris RN66]EEA05142.1 hypothetical protein CMU_042150 [Cryptosporidium muris RN66]|eukprot:XP_002139491.1 hypothetical protein [Cryptosporidium muris RN66]